MVLESHEQNRVSDLGRLMYQEKLNTITKKLYEYIDCIDRLDCDNGDDVSEGMSLVAFLRSSVEKIPQAYREKYVEIIETLGVTSYGIHWWHTPEQKWSSVRMVLEIIVENTSSLGKEKIGVYLEQAFKYINDALPEKGVWHCIREGEDPMGPEPWWLFYPSDEKAENFFRGFALLTEDLLT